MLCELCGIETNSLNQTIIEGAMLNVCNNCAKHGVIVKKAEVRIAERSREKPLTQKKEQIDIIVQDYAERIKKARERKNLTQEELAKALAEKTSVIQRIEAGQLKPSLQLARKLQQFLGIELIEQYKEPEQGEKINFKDKSLTIGDLVRKSA